MHSSGRPARRHRDNGGILRDLDVGATGHAPKAVWASERGKLLRPSLDFSGTHGGAALPAASAPRHVARGIQSREIIDPLSELSTARGREVDYAGDHLSATVFPPIPTDDPL